MFFPFNNPVTWLFLPTVSVLPVLQQRLEGDGYAPLVGGAAGAGAGDCSGLLTWQCSSHSRQRHDAAPQRFPFPLHDMMFQDIYMVISIPVGG